MNTKSKTAKPGAPSPKSGAPSRGREKRRQRATRQWWQGSWVLPGAIGLIVIAAIGAFMLIAQQQVAAGLPSGSEWDTIVSQVTQVPADVFDAVGTGGVNNPLAPDTAGQAPQGKPQFLYVGAEFCPYCASERWSLMVALSRFGQFQNVRPTQSMSNDVYPNTPTFTFYHSEYTSQYVDFAPVETETREQAPLQKPSDQQQSLMDAYDTGGSIPFVDIGNRYHASGSGIDTSLVATKTWQEIAAALSQPTDPTTKAIVGNANYLTAGICQATGNQPASVCGSPAISAILGQMNSANPSSQP